MSHWNYRVIQKPVQDTEDLIYEIHEVYYSDDGEIDGWTENPVKPFGESGFELREDIRHFLEAFRHPILEEKKVDEIDILTEIPYGSKVNQGHDFEFMDKTSIAIDYIYQFLGTHPLLKKEKQLRELYSKAARALSDLERYISKRKKDSPEFEKEFEAGHEDFKRILDRVPDRKPFPGDEP